MAASNGSVTAFPAANGTRLQDRVPIDAITADARQARPGRAMLGLIGYLLFGVGWVVAKTFAVAFLSSAWCFSAVKMGWRTARGEPLSQPDLEEVLAENQRLRAELARVS
jgi:hypothetical protein